MKKLTLLIVAYFICVSTFSMRYLVQTGNSGDVSWRTPVAEETLIDLKVLGKSINEWLTSTTFTSGDEIWITKGTYLFTGSYLLPTSGLSICGGFKGTETLIADREKGAEKWDFPNETFFDGNNSYRVVVPGGNRPETVIDGITFINGKGAEGTLKVARGMLVQNCKFLNNYCTGSGGAIINFGGDVIACYFKGNHGSYGGAMQVFNTVDDNTKILECIFEENSADNNPDPTKGNQGGAVRVQGAKGVVTIDRCVFKNNTALLNGAAVYIIAPTEAENHTTVSNCLMYENTNKAAVFMYGGTLYNCTVVNNFDGGVYVGGAAITAKIYNTVFWGDLRAGNVDGVANHSEAIIQNTAYNKLSQNFTGPLNLNNILLDMANSGEDFLAYYPNFVDPENNNWQLAKGSSLIDAGQKIASVTTDLLGSSRPHGTAYDIGAYEFSSITSVDAFPERKFTYFTTSHSLEIRSISENIHVKVYNTAGVIVKSVFSNSSSVSLNIAKGVYILSVNGQNVKVVVK